MARCIQPRQMSAVVRQLTRDRVMKHTTPEALLSRELLCFVRDHAPTVEEFLARYGGTGGQCYHVLRKSGVLEVDGDRVRLSRRLLSPDGQCFAWRSWIIRL